MTVTDGRLTIRSGAGASNNKICFVEITAQIAPSHRRSTESTEFDTEKCRSDFEV